MNSLTISDENFIWLMGFQWVSCVWIYLFRSLVNQ